MKFALIALVFPLLAGTESDASLSLAGTGYETSKTIGGTGAGIDLANPT